MLAVERRMIDRKGGTYDAVEVGVEHVEEGVGGGEEAIGFGAAVSHLLAKRPDANSGRSRETNPMDRWLAVW